MMAVMLIMDGDDGDNDGVYDGMNSDNIDSDEKKKKKVDHIQKLESAFSFIKVKNYVTAIDGNC